MSGTSQVATDALEQTITNRRLTMMRMLKIALAVNLAFASCSGLAKGGTHAVKGHVTKDGTYVVPHRATNPNGTKTDNYSSKPNTNPYTGKAGKLDPQKPTKVKR
jgi:hypothetical protein